MRRGISATGALHPDAAWERYAVPSAWPSWSPQIRYVECAQDRLAAGLTGRVHGWFGVTADFHVLSVDEVRRTWSWRARSGPVTLTLHHAVLPVAEGSQTTLEIDGPALVVLLYAPLAQVALRRLVRP
jgi:Polyketide cyclase / dehydrase and lipid transport